MYLFFMTWMVVLGCGCELVLLRRPEFLVLPSRLALLVIVTLVVGFSVPNKGELAWPVEPFAALLIFSLFWFLPFIVGAAFALVRSFLPVSGARWPTVVVLVAGAAQLAWLYYAYANIH
jgi:hypothetical protein